MLNLLLTSLCLGDGSRPMVLLISDLAFDLQEAFVVLLVSARLRCSWRKVRPLNRGLGFGRMPFSSQIIFNRKLIYLYLFEIILILI